MAGDDVNIRVTATTTQAQRAFRDLKGEVRGLKGTLIPLAAAAAPLAAAMAPIAVKAAGAGVAVAAFGAAVAGQVSHLSDASSAQDKYTDAVTKYGRGSKQAAEAQRLLSTTLSSMPQATARAAVGLQTLKTNFKSWSDELSGFTMTPVEKGFTLLDQLLPRLTPMVKGASTQLDRLMSVAGGAMTTSGFDVLADKVSTFANQSLKDATDGAIHFARALSQGEASGPIKAFMEYAEKNGPVLRETLRNVGEAVMTLVEASADAGPGMLTLVNAAAKLVASLPPGLVATLMQAAVALKAVRLASAGFDAAAGLVAAFSARLTALRTTATTAGGGMAGLNAVFSSTKAKIGLAAGAVGALVLTLHELSGNKAPVAVDELSTSLNTLVTTGKVTGALKTNFKEISESIAMVSKGASDNKFAQLTSDFGTWIGVSTGPGISDARKNVDAWDKSMAQLVESGHTREAAAQYEILKKAWVAGGGDLKRLGKFTDDYKNALADQKFEAKLAADSMGVFGQAAQDTSAKLDAQTASADGLRQSILALNETNRSAYDAQIGFEASLDDLTASFEKNGATLDLNTEKGRANGEAMSQAAKAQDDFIAAGVAAGDSLGSMTKKSDELRSTMLKLATEAFDGNKSKAREYVNTLLGAPSEIKTLVKLEREDAISGLKAVKAAFQAQPNAKKITVDTLNGAAIKALEAVGLKVKQLPNGKTQVTTKNGSALSAIDAVRRALNNLNGKTAVTWTINKVKTEYSLASHISGGKSAHELTGATGGLFTGKRFRYADGGPVSGPGTGTSDDVFAPWLSNGEFVIKAASVRKYGERFLQRLNDGRVEMPRFAKGGKVSKQAKAEQQARHDAMGDLTVSHFGQYAGYQRSEFGSSLAKPDSIGALVNALNQWRSIIMKATHGSTESKLLKQLDQTGKQLLKYEKQLNTVTKSLEKAKDKLNSLKDAAASLASSVKGNLISSANITKGASGEGPVTLSSIKSGMVAGRDKVVAFASALKQLKAKGFSKTIIQQVAEAGIDGGGLETAGALLQASSSEVQSINQLQGQIESAAGSAGKTTADAVYGGAIKWQQMQVNKLSHSQEKLSRSMDKLAKTMEKSIEQAFKGKAAGGIVGAAASGGIRSNLTWVGEQGPELLDLPAGSRVWSNADSRRKAAPWASMLNTYHRAPVGPARAAVAPGGDGQPLVIQVRIGERDFGELWVDTGRKAVRARGSIEATLRPPRGR
ncbi:phage tail protein [Streptomyces sp. NPDC020490]|uniref:phage tail protein n=1 Tax=Streptomyces sp. NPDC020490 TaxID=3365078 RepID=UPI00378C1FFA